MLPTHRYGRWPLRQVGTTLPLPVEMPQPGSGQRIDRLLTGSEDKTVRLWDIQTGRCVRLLNGCSAGIYQVKVDPSGQYAVGADAMGIIHMWDLGTGKKVTEFRAKAMSSDTCYPEGDAKEYLGNVARYEF